MMNVKLAIYRFAMRLTHRHDWRCTDEPISPTVSSERPYWHVDRCECGATRESMSNGYTVGAHHDSRV